MTKEKHLSISQKDMDDMEALDKAYSEADNAFEIALEEWRARNPGHVPDEEPDYEQEARERRP